MSNKNNIWNKPAFKYAVLLLIGLFVGWLIFGGSQSHSHELTPDSENSKQVIYTCSMHPQIRQDTPGKCPLCGMDLTPLKSSESGEDDLDDSAIVMSKSAVALANIQTTVVTASNPVKDIELYGSIEVDERAENSQSAHVSGRIEKLYVNFTGETVKQGQLLATIYSGELLSAQQELLEALKLQDFQPLLLQGAKEKLKYYKMTPSQIQKLIDTKTASALVNIYSNTQGTVVSKNVNPGDYIEQGAILYNISNLSSVWAVFDAYEQDLPFLKVNDPVSYTLQSRPGEVFQGKISFINPILDPQSRTAKIRVETQNKNLDLMPSMYAKAVIKASLKNLDNQIVIPKSAVLWTGKRSLVYIKIPNTSTPAFQMKEVVLGPSLGDSYVILEGLQLNEQVVTNGVFVLDASAQLEGKNSMMNTQDHSEHSQAHYTHSVLVNGNCEMCKERILSAANALNGVIASTWDAETKKLDLNLDTSKITLDQVSKAVALQGHQTQFHQVDQKTYEALPGCCKYDKQALDSLTQQDQGQSWNLKVSGNCSMCQKRIQDAASALKGVHSALWDVDSQELTVLADPKLVTLQQISQSIAKVGHQTQLHAVDQDVYQSLPGCCKYDIKQDLSTSKNNSTVVQTLQVSGNCAMCQKRIQDAANSINGVNSAIWEVDTKVLTLEIDPKATTLEKVSEIVAQVGHDTNLHQASESSYQGLHGCCKYPR